MTTDIQRIIFLTLIVLAICGVLASAYLIETWKDIQKSREAGTLDE